MEELLEDLPYYRESVDGGVTFSGGECMLQLDFLEEMLRAPEGGKYTYGCGYGGECAVCGF